MWGIEDSVLNTHFVKPANDCNYLKRVIDYKDFCKKERPKMKIGDIAYWVEGDFQRGWNVKYGVIDEIYHDGYIANYLTPNKILKVRLNGNIHVINNQKELVSYFESLSWRKLPSTWSYDTVLFQHEYVLASESCGKISIKNSEQIKVALNEGSLIREKDSLTHTYVVSSVIDDGKWKPVIESKGYRNMSKIVPSDIFLNKTMTFDNYDDAKTLANKMKEEQMFIASMSDKDYALFEIVNNLDRACHFSHSLSERDAKKIHNYMLNVKNLAKVESRFMSEGFQWRYFDEKKWHTVKPDTLMDDGTKW
jgi:hypothetical protein